MPRCMEVDNGAVIEAFLRNKVTPSPTSTRFVPTTLSDATAASMLQKRAQLGATLKGKLSRLPKVNARVLWEVEASRAPPAAVRPVKPKLWLTVACNLAEGYLYLLE